MCFDEGLGDLVRDEEVLLRVMIRREIIYNSYPPLSVFPSLTLAPYQDNFNLDWNFTHSIIIAIITVTTSDSARRQRRRNLK